MKEELVALLAKSRIFSPYKHAPKAKVQIEALNDYRFFICNCFGHGPDSFEAEIKNLLSQYINVWAKILDEEKKLDWKEHSQNVFRFFDPFDWDKIYKAVEAEKNSFTFDIKANNSKIRVKRFGDILAFDILKNGENEHKTGLNALKALCRAEDPSNNQGVYELIHKVSVSISMTCQESGGKHLFDFKQVLEQLKVALPKADWGFSADHLIEGYLNGDSSFIEEEFMGFKTTVALIHEEQGPGNSDYRQNARIWRSGNVKRVKEGEYQFENASDVLLRLTLRSSLPDSFMPDTEMESKFHREQFQLAEVAAIFIAQLCAMQLTKYRESMAAAGY